MRDTIDAARLKPLALALWVALDSYPEPLLDRLFQETSGGDHPSDGPNIRDAFEGVLFALIGPGGLPTDRVTLGQPQDL